jgi:AbrB family looped-hinge helix DNA binding protein
MAPGDPTFGLPQSFGLTFMAVVKLLSKGRVVLPKVLRDAHRWPAGTEFVVEDTADGVLLRAVKAFAVSRLEDVAGCLRTAGKPRTIAEMDGAIDDEIRARCDRAR